MIKSIDNLREISRRLYDDIMLRKEDHADKRVIVRMGDTGLAGGARDVLAAFVEQVHERRLCDVMVTQSGDAECPDDVPAVCVIMPGAEPVEYVRVTAQAAAQIVEEHICGGRASDAAARK